MAPIRIHAQAEADGELHLRGLPLQKGQGADVIIVPEASDDQALMTFLQHDPTWAWLRDEAEDLYSE